jgi:L-alanine-DL-glutamate epimerase-like enolase superfamily enzyme
MKLDATAYTIPCDAPESDGTFEWDSTTIVIVRADEGLGYTYGPAVLADLIRGPLAAVVCEEPVAAFDAMVAAIRNMGPWGLAMYAVSAVDVALWDRKARRLGVALSTLLGRRREAVPVYGSGGFCSYSDAQLTAQLGGWAREGFTRVKMKVGRDAADDPRRVGVARAAIGPDVELMVDANGAWDAAEAIAMAERFAEHDVRWFEEPVSSDDLDGLARVRARVPAGMAVAAGEYATDPYTFARIAGVVDVLQADVTRCGGVTGFLRSGVQSAHCAPNLSAHVMTAVPHARHIEYFHDHVRIERMLFDGALEVVDSALRPDADRRGHGLALRVSEAEPYRV